MFSGFEFVVYELSTWYFKSSSGLCESVWDEVFLYVFIRHEIASHLQHHKKPIDLTKQERGTLQKLTNHDSIVILAADKGRTTVVIDKTEYINKAEELLQDTSTYKKLNKDPTKTTVSRINKN